MNHKNINNLISARESLAIMQRGYIEKKEAVMESDIVLDINQQISDLLALKESLMPEPVDVSKDIEVVDMQIALAMDTAGLKEHSGYKIKYKNKNKVIKERVLELVSDEMIKNAWKPTSKQVKEWAKDDPRLHICIENSRDIIGITID